MTREELKEIIAFAVENEVDAYEFYRDAAERLEDQGLKQTFKDLAEDELEHKKFLEEFLENNTDEINIDVEADYKVSETVEKPPLSMDMSFADAIQLAMKNEEEAMDMYQQLADAVTDEKEKNIFIGLRDMEKMHKTKLEDIYVNAAFVEVW